MSATAIILLNAVQGLFSGTLFGMLESWSKKALYVVLAIGGIYILLVTESQGASAVVEPLTPLWGYAIFVLTFIGGQASGRKLHTEAFGGQA